MLRHWRWGAIPAVLIGLTLLAAWHVWSAASGLLEARDELRALEERLEDASWDTVTADDLAFTRERLLGTRDGLERTRTHLRRNPVLRLGALAPGAPGDQLRAVYAFLDMGGTVLEAGLAALPAAEKALPLRDDPPDGERLPAAVAALLAAVKPESERLAALTGELTAQRLALGDAPLLPPLDALRRGIDENLPMIADRVETLNRWRPLIPGLLGLDGERRYLLLLLNEGELMPGGGLVTASGVLVLHDGGVSFEGVTDAGWWRASWDERDGRHIEPPPPLERHLLRGYPWHLALSNWDPHFPAWARQALEFEELGYGERDVHGVLAVDFRALVDMLALTGPIAVEVSRLFVEHWSVPPVERTEEVSFTAGNAILEISRLARSLEGTRLVGRKSFLGEVGPVLVERLLALPPERWEEALATIRRLGEGRHVQALFLDEREQTLLRAVRWDGRLETPEGGDYLHFNEASVRSTKLNFVIRPEGSWSVALDRFGGARHELTLAYHNTLPEWSEGKDPALVQQMMLGGRYGGYLRVFGPEGLIAPSVAIDGATAPIEDRGVGHGKRWFGAFLPVESGERRTVALRWAVPHAASADGRAYDLYLQKQAGVAGICLELAVTREGEPPAELAIEGGRLDEDGRLCLESDARLRARW